MKLRTSFFNVRVLLKNLTRFAPLWVLYTIGEVLGLMLLDLETPSASIAGDLAQLMGPVSLFHAGYALLVAACLFGDLFDSRMCNGLHAMPMRREGWLLTNLASGLVFALIPAIVGGGVAALFLGKYWWVALAWQGTSLLQFVLFFGLAVFSAMCAGKRLGMFAVYAIFNFLSLLIYWVADNIFVPLLPGVVASDYWFAKFCPLISLMGSKYLDYSYDSILGGFFRGYLMDSWYYLFICAGVGMIFILFAWLLYRKRNLETAGDFIVFRPVAILFLLSYTLGLGVLLYSFGELFGWYKNFGFLTVGLLIGWFTGWMLLERTVKIFTKKVFLSLLAFIVLFTGAVGLTILDPMGIVTYIPKTEEIATANLYLQSDVYYYNGDDGYGGWDITDPEGIAQVQALHQAMTETSVKTGANGNRTYFSDRMKSISGNLEVSEIRYLNIYVNYRLKNGRLVYRTYKVPAESEMMEELRPFFSDPRAIFNVNDWEQVKTRTTEIIVYYEGGNAYKEVELHDKTQVQALFAAIEADCEAGVMAQDYDFHPDQAVVAGINVEWKDTYKLTDMGEIYSARNEHLVIFEDSANTLAFMETLLKN